MTQHFDEIGHVHMLTFSTFHHKKLFWDEELAKLFLNHLDFERRKGKFSLYAYVVMPDHVHLIVHPEPDEIVSSILHGIKRGFSWQAIDYLKQNGMESKLNELLATRKGSTACRFWQIGGGYDRNIFTDNVLREMIIYIHSNPVRKQMVTLPEDYPWSSACAWMEGMKPYIPVDIPEWWRE